MFDSPLRYPGGKGRLTQYVIDLIEMNDLGGGHYVETYAGGAGIAVTLLYLEYVSHVHLNDIDKAVYSFWKAAIESTDSFVKLIHETPLNIDERLRQKAIYKDCNSSFLDLGFATFYLNRTNRSGIIHGGVIGGSKQDGVYKIDARFNRKELARRVEKLASYKSRISLYNKDAADIIACDLSNIPKKTLVYLDPPYYANGSRLYRNTYKHKDHAQIADLTRTIEQPWIVSYDDAPEVCSLYKEYRQQKFGLGYSANSRYKGTEVMIYSDQVKIPGLVEPFRGFAA